MTAKQFLLQSVRIREKMFYIQERIEKLEADLGYHPLQLDDSGASKASVTDKVGDKLAEIADLSNKYIETRLELEKKNEEIRSLIESLDNPTYRSVMSFRYISENNRFPTRLNSWVTVAFKVGLPNEDTARMTHNRALKILEKNFKCVR